jgi:hypothetical protein
MDVLRSISRRTKQSGLPFKQIVPTGSPTSSGRGDGPTGYCGGLVPQTVSTKRPLTRLTNKDAAPLSGQPAFISRARQRVAVHIALIRSVGGRMSTARTGRSSTSMRPNAARTGVKSARGAHTTTGTSGRSRLISAAASVLPHDRGRYEDNQITKQKQSSAALHQTCDRLVSDSGRQQPAERIHRRLRGAPAINHQNLRRTVDGLIASIGPNECVVVLSGAW